MVAEGYGASKSTGGTKLGGRDVSAKALNHTVERFIYL